MNTQMSRTITMSRTIRMNTMMTIHVFKASMVSEISSFSKLQNFNEQRMTHLHFIAISVACRSRRRVYSDGCREVL